MHGRNRNCCVFHISDAIVIPIFINFKFQLFITRKKINFCNLILCSVTLLNSIIGFKSIFFLDTVGFSFTVYAYIIDLLHTSCCIRIQTALLFAL